MTIPFDYRLKPLPLSKRFARSAALYYLLFVAGIGLFAWFIASVTLAKGIAFAGLLLSSFILYYTAQKQGNLSAIWSSPKPVFNKRSMLFLAMLLGPLIGAAYRTSLGMTALPQAISWFALTAACIGITEEIIFRGVIFYILQKQSAVICILSSSLAHAGYKTLLFLSPYAVQQVDTAQVFTYTFIAGLLLGSMRWYAASASSPVLAHASWDAIAYGDSPAAPWWVW